MQLSSRPFIFDPKDKSTTNIFVYVFFCFLLLSPTTLKESVSIPLCFSWFFLTPTPQISPWFSSAQQSKRCHPFSQIHKQNLSSFIFSNMNINDAHPSAYWTNTRRFPFGLYKRYVYFGVNYNLKDSSHHTSHIHTDIQSEKIRPKNV